MGGAGGEAGAATPLKITTTTIKQTTITMARTKLPLAIRKLRRAHRKNGVKYLLAVMWTKADFENEKRKQEEYARNAKKPTKRV